VLLDLLSRRTDPRADLPADVPGGIVPQQHQDPFPLDGQPLAEPGEQGSCDVTDGSAVDKPPQDLVGVESQQPIASQGVGGRILFRAVLLDQSQGRTLGPTAQGRLGQTTPPGCSGKAQDPVGMLRGQADQAVAVRFLNAYWGSGLVIQRLARRQFTPSRLSAWRIVSMLTGYGVNPRSQQTSAAKRSVQVLRGLPKARGRSCSRARNCSPLPASSTARVRLGRRDRADNEASPRMWKAWIALRTLWVAQLSCWAICAGRCPRALASSIWHRRRVNAFGDRSPVSSCWCSSGVNDRMYRGGFITHKIPAHSLSHKLYRDTTLGT
jgi:hypothetical protein